MEEAVLVRGGALIVDPAAHLVRVDGREVELSVLEFRLLHFLVTHPGQTFSRDELVSQIWRTQDVTPRAVDASISRIRLKIEPDARTPSYLLTTHGKGYRFARFTD